MSRILNLSKRVTSYSRKFVVHRYVKGSRRSFFFFFFLFLKILLDTIRFPKKFPRKFVSIRSIGRYNCDALLKGERGGKTYTLWLPSVRFDVSESGYTRRRREWWLETTVSLRCLGKIFGLANIWRLSTASNHCAPLHRLFHLINDVYQRSRCWCTLTESSLQHYRSHSCRRARFIINIIKRIIISFACKHARRANIVKDIDSNRSFRYFSSRNFFLVWKIGIGTFPFQRLATIIVSQS